MSDPQNPDVPTPPPGYGQTPPSSSGATPPPPSYGTTPPAQPTYSSAPPAAQPTYSSAPPAPYGAPASPTVPGKTMGIVAFILSFFIQIVALVLGIIALVQSRKAGYKNGWAVAAIIISAVLLVLGIIVGIFVAITFSAAAAFAAEAFQACQAVDFSGTVTVQGVTVDCATIDRR